MKKAKNKKPTVIDLFSGAGGLSSGFRDAGFEIVAAIEKTSIFCKTHSLNFPESIIVNADISLLAPADFAKQTKVKSGKIDVIIGGPPCQSFSTIGTPKINSLKGQNVQTDPRNYLFQSYFDYIKYYNPTLFVMENVPTLKTKYGGLLFDRIVEIINELGYIPHVATLNSVEYGVPQNRKRLFIIGAKPSINFNFPKATHILINEKSILSSSNLQIATTVNDALSDLPRIYDGCREDELPYHKINKLTKYQTFIRNSSGKVRNNICRVSNERAKKVFAHMKQGQKYMDLPKEVRAILPFREDIFHDRLKRLELTKPSWTVLAHIGMDGYMYIHPTEDRTLSVREAARLQSFHDSFLFVGNMREQYIQVGNAVPILLAQAVANSVKEAFYGK